MKKRMNQSCIAPHNSQFVEDLYKGYGKMKPDRGTILKDLQDNLKVALVQAAPVMFDKQACVEKAAALIQEASEKKPDLIVFPELFVPGYPFGLTFGFTVGHRDEEGREDYKFYYDQSILISGWTF